MIVMSSEVETSLTIFFSADVVGSRIRDSSTSLGMTHS
jgi:hypothetical protein